MRLIQYQVVLTLPGGEEAVGSSLSDALEDAVSWIHVQLAADPSGWAAPLLGLEDHRLRSWVREQAGL